MGIVKINVLWLIAILCCTAVPMDQNVNPSKQGVMNCAQCKVDYADLGLHITQKHLALSDLLHICLCNYGSCMQKNTPIVLKMLVAHINFHKDQIQKVAETPIVQQTVQANEKIKTPDNPPDIWCAQCQQSYPDIADITVHIRQKHLDIAKNDFRKLICTFGNCSKEGTCLSEHMVRCHLNMHKMQKNECIQVRTNDFNTNVKLYQKIISNQNSRREKSIYQCELCTTCLNSAESLAKHRGEHADIMACVLFACRHNGCQESLVSYAQYLRHHRNHVKSSRKCADSVCHQQHKDNLALHKDVIKRFNQSQKLSTTFEHIIQDVRNQPLDLAPQNNNIELPFDADDVDQYICFDYELPDNKKQRLQ